MLVKIDAAYPKEAKAGEMRKFTPKRFNPDNRAGLPIFHTTREVEISSSIFQNYPRLWSSKDSCLTSDLR